MLRHTVEQYRFSVCEILWYKWTHRLNTSCYFFIRIFRYLSHPKLNLTFHLFLLINNLFCVFSGDFEDMPNLVDAESRGESPNQGIFS